MVVFCRCIMVLCGVVRRPQKVPDRRPAWAVAGVLFPLGMFPPVNDAYREILQTRSYFLLQRWEWYEWLGILRHCFAGVVPRIARSVTSGGCPPLWCRDHPVRSRILRGWRLMVSIPALENLAEFSPCAACNSCTFCLFVVTGGLLAQFVLKRLSGAGWPVSAAFVRGCYMHNASFFPRRRRLSARSPIQQSLGTGFPMDRDHTPRTPISRSIPSTCWLRQKTNTDFAPWRNARGWRIASKTAA